MNHKEITLDFKTREKIIPRLPQVPGEPEMSIYDSAFLCGLLRSVRPQKVLEIGVAGGGTTAIILQCLEDMHQQYEMHSVDISEKLYTNHALDTGWMGRLAKDLLETKNHTYHIGGCVTDWISEIGSDIDFLLLDSAHCVPGEILDFLILLPRLKENAVVCLHDMTTCQQLVLPGATTLFGNIVLYNSVSADKIWNLMPDECERRIPNLAAFRIIDETRKNIMSVIGSLLVPWEYIPSQKDLDNYTREIHSIYNADECLLYDEAVSLNVVRYGLLENRLKVRNGLLGNPFTKGEENFRIMLLGAGDRGKRFYNYLKKVGLENTVAAWVDDDLAGTEGIDGRRITSHEEMDDVSCYNYAIITDRNLAEIAKIRGYLYKLGMDDGHIITLKIW